MSAHTLLRPVLSLVGFTFAMEVWLYALRIPGVTKYKVKVSNKDQMADFEKQFPPEVRWPANAYNHLHEAPTRFYAISLGLALIQAQSTRPNPMVLETNLAWTYVAIRIVHGIIYAKKNPIMVRFGIYLVSEFVMLGLLGCAATYVL